MMAPTLNLFPSRAAIGTVQQNGDVLMTAEFSRALAALMVRVGGPSGISTDDIQVLAALGENGDSELIALRAEVEQLRAQAGLGAQVVQLQRQVEQLSAQVEMLAPMANLRGQLEQVRNEVAMIVPANQIISYAQTRYAPLKSPSFTGTPTAPTAAVNTNTAQLATCAYVLNQASTAAPAMDGTAAAGQQFAYARSDHVHPTDTSRAALASPTFTGTPAAPTAAVNTNSTQLATCAYVLNQASNITPSMDGTAAAGNQFYFARADHVHPTDTSRQAKINPPTVTGGRNGNVALASLLQGLASVGLIVNNTTDP